ncbi:GlxA family transcriptional regulator [Mycobacterium sp. 050134]|uniref:GlxA family transcriptional regulator n=1 Tax=Mycobacterium sp. 050134 TaxID=3096111 RepID=UPI002EDBA2C5
MTATTTHLVAVTVFPGVDAVDVAGPAEVFAMANLALPDGAPNYEVRVIASRREPVRTFSGLRLAVDQAFGELDRPPDTLVVTGRVDMSPTRGPVAIVDPQVVNWLRHHGTAAARIAAVCAGSNIVAAAGLLDGHRATTHWGTAAQLAAEYPLVEVDADPIFVRSGRIWTSAGITASMDLALALVGNDHGEDIALKVAQLMVMYVQRPGGQSQFSAALSVPSGSRPDIAELRRWIGSHLADDLTVPALARRVAVTPRHLTRVFQADVGLAPGEFVERMRVEHARRLLERTDLAPERIASECGLGSARTLYRLFRDRLGTTPGEYRQRFAGAPV